ncbi:MAG: integrase arm-type DNA-binding domain-containing protein [Pseudomonadota bacterium]
MRESNRLNGLSAKSLGPGKHHDGRGLYLVKTAAERGKWILRLTIYGRRREMGLGPYPTISLQDARRKAEEARYAVLHDRDPIAERQNDTQHNRYLLQDVAELTLEARKAELKEDGKAGRWMSPLDLHVLPKLGRTPIAKLTQNDIAAVLRPIWHTKTETARKALNRLNLTLKHGAAMGLDVDIQAVTKARALLGTSKHTPKHVPAMAWQDVPEFYASLNDGSICHLALRLLILTGVRSKPLRHAHIDQIDEDVWTIPEDLMKGAEGKVSAFRVPLSKPAQKIAEEALQHSRDGHLFPSVRKGVISDATMAQLMKRRGLAARPHGFRSSLRTWLAEETNAPFEVSETILAHNVMNKVQRAYQRSDYLELRAELMGEWANYVVSKV